jgi:ATP-dependent DNA helicase RecG
MIKFSYSKQRISTGQKITKKIGENVTENTVENVTKNVTERESVILDIIRSNVKITTVQLANKLNIARMTIHRDLEKLKEKGLLERIGPNKGGYWQAKDDISGKT